MQLDFSVLTKARQKQTGQLGTHGTANIHTGLARPDSAKMGRDKAGRSAPVEGALSRLSRLPGYRTGHGNASVYTVVPPDPSVPSQKHNATHVEESKRDGLARVLRQFDFAKGRERLNDMTFEFMVSDGLGYEQALAIASEVVRVCGVAPCEKSYQDVRSSWNRIRGVA